MVDCILYEHADGRYAVNPDTGGDPGWYRLGPVDVSAIKVTVPPLAANHMGLRVNYIGMLASCRGAMNPEIFPGAAEMLRQLQGHMGELGKRWYAGDATVVDEFLQLYCVEEGARAELAGQHAAPAAPEPDNTTAPRDEFPMLYDSLDALADCARYRDQRMARGHVQSLRASIQALVQTLSMTRARVAELESREGAAAQKPVTWWNGCDKTVPAALRYLADNDRPGGGEQAFNAAHLFQLASEVERMASTPLYAAPVVAPAPASRAGTADGCRLDWIERQDGIRATRVPAKPGVRGYWLIERSPQDEDRARGVNLRDALDSGMKLWPEEGDAS